MSIFENDHIKTTLELPCFGFLGAVETNNLPIIRRVFSYKVDDNTDILTVFINESDAAHIIDCLINNKKASVGLADAAKMKSLQLKGDFVKTVKLNEDDKNIIIQRITKQSSLLDSYGLQPNVISNWNIFPSIGIQIKVLEIFNQTPKTGTGNKL